uniref:Phosphatidylinositol 4,5-bisphosphate 3-kinase catalytic subunit delta isoform n=1 Tax=Cacopsylla melanoneura TaxID=428564 RepID=A0A8D9EW02_9HEMI
MVHRIASPECNFDYWNAKSVETRAVVELNCLMPNGVFIILEAPRNATLSEIKEDLWDEAAKYPLHGMLKDVSCYVFSLINNMAEHEEIHDENKRICDVKPFYRILKIVERQGDKADIILNSQISHLIGKGLHEFDQLRSSEVNVYRSNMKQLTNEAARERHTKPWLDKLCYQFPPRICPPSLSITREETNGRLREGQFMVVIKFETAENTFTLPVSTETTPTELLRMILNKKAITLHTSGEQTSDYVLKVCGQEEYLVGELPLLQFCYIQECLSRERTPVLVTVSVESVPLHDEKIYDNPDDLETRSTRSSFSTLTLRKKGRYTSSWNIRERFQFHVGKVSRINCDTTRPGEVSVPRWPPPVRVSEDLRETCAKRRSRV